MNQPVATPIDLRPAACPLLAAVLPVRYAIGPIDPRHGSSLDAAALGLPEFDETFPGLGPDNPYYQGRPLGYVPRMLRDGWLYLWDEALQELNEYRVQASMLTLSGRGGGLQDQALRPYLLLEAGAPVRLAWSPCLWSESIFAMVEQQPDLRQRLMREIIPGVSPFSGQVKTLHSQIGDIRPENFRWSCAPRPRYWLLEDPALKRMQRCEQQHFALVDDPWGVLFDFAGLMRERTQAFGKLNKHRVDEWSIAAIVESMGSGDEKVRGRLGSIIDLARLQQVKEEQERETQALEADCIRMAKVWAAWFSTLGEGTPSSLESACEHFDISQPDAREMLENSFAAACLGPAATSPGVKAIENALDLTQVKGQPWLLWALLGVTQRLDAGHLQRLLQMPEGLPTVAEDLGASTAKMARASTLALTLNAGAANLEKLPLARGGEPLFAVFSTVLGGRVSELSEQIHHLTYQLMIAMLARSRQRLEAGSLAPADALRWMSSQIDEAHNKGKRRSLERRLDQHRRQEGRAARMTAADARPARSSLASGVSSAIPHLRVVPSTPPAEAGSYRPGYGSATPNPRPAPPPVLPPLSGEAAGLELPRNIKDLLNDAPLKTLIAMVSVWNLREVGQHVWQGGSVKEYIAVGSAFWTSTAALTAVVQHLADTRWEQHIAQAGNINPAAQEYLARALGLGSAAMFFQALAAGIDVFYFGWRALDAYRAGDLDTAGVNVGLSGASLAYARLSAEAMRTMRLARTAVLAGEAQALTTGLRVLSLPLRLSLVGLAVTVIAGLVTLFFTEDKPLEQWLKQTRFGNRPADWSGSFAGTLRALYQIVLPVSLSLERWQDINPRTGQVMRELRLVLRLPGQQEYRQGMVSFEGEEEWQYKTGLFSSEARCVPLIWGKDDPIPFYPDVGSRITPERNGIRLRRAYHDDGRSSLVAVRGRLTYQPINGLYLPPIDIDVS